MDDRLLAGYVGKPHGVSGEVYVVRISDDPARFEPGRALVHEDGRVLTIAAARPHRDRLLMTFEGVSDRDAAEALRGPVYVPASGRRTLDPGEFWPDDLIGCTVMDGDGRDRGTVTDVTATPAHDMLVVDGVHMVPMVGAIVTAVDVTARLVHIDPPEGLLP